MYFKCSFYDLIYLYITFTVIKLGTYESTLFILTPFLAPPPPPPPPPPPVFGQKNVLRNPSFFVDVICLDDAGEVGTRWQ